MRMVEEPVVIQKGAVKVGTPGVSGMYGEGGGEDKYKGMDKSKEHAKRLGGSLRIVNPGVDKLASGDVHVPQPHHSPEVGRTSWRGDAAHDGCIPETDGSQ